MKKIIKPYRPRHFNTSYVTVQHWLIHSLQCQLLHFNTSYVAVQQFSNNGISWRRWISIHLMLRFNLLQCLFLLMFKSISIHLMLRFNRSFKSNASSNFCISIHLMLRFNPCKSMYPEIICNNFNTSYVAVQRYRI